MNNKSAIVLLTFIVAITPSLSDMVQLNDERPGFWLYVALWYLLLLAILFQLWEKIPAGG